MQPAGGMDGEGQKVEDQQDRSQVLLAVPEVPLQIAAVLEGVEAFILESTIAMLLFRLTSQVP